MDEAVMVVDGAEPQTEESLRAEMEALKAERAARLDQMGAALAVKRRAAINFRRQSGIEKMWDEDDDAYDGVDEASKADNSDWRSRPAGMAMPQKNDARSTVVLNITKPYVNAFASKIIDMRLQINDRAWKLKPTPVPELREMLRSDKQVSVNGETVRESELAGQIMAKAKESAGRAQLRIDDWLVEGRWDGSARQVIDDMARIGTGVEKGPFPDVYRHRKYSAGEVQVTERIRPMSKRVSVRNIFPDPACGENVHDGDYIFERDFLTHKRLEDMRGTEGALDDQIEAVLLEGPRASDVAFQEGGQVKNDKTKEMPFELWYYTGILRKDDVEAAGCECESEHDSVSVSVTVVNEHVVRMALNPLDDGSFPYDVVPCSRKEGSWAGIGVAHEMRTPQRMVTGAIRKLNENLGLSSGPQIVYRKGVLIPQNGDYTITGNKLWYVGKDADVQQVQHAFQLFNIDSRQAELMATIQFALKIAEDVTGLPMILQGQQGTAPDVLGVVQILNENATSVARRVAKMVDDCLIGPHIRRYYNWLMQYGEDDSEKGDCEIEVLMPPEMTADTSVSKDLLQMALNPAFGMNPKLVAQTILKQNRIDPASVAYTPDEIKQMQEAQQVSDPRIEAANIKAKADAQITQMRTQADEQMAVAKMRFEQAEGEKDRQLEMMLAAMDGELGQAGLTVEARKALEAAKVKLADTTIKVRAQREMQMQNHAVQMSKPPVEPAGRAPDGKAYIQ